jgi:hypothetical protein
MVFSIVFPVYLHDDFTPIRIFLSSSMDKDKPEHLELRRALKLLFKRQKLFRLEMIENTGAPEGPDPRMRRMVEELDWVIFVFHHEDSKEGNPLLIRPGIKTEMDLVLTLKKPAIGFIEKSLDDDKSGIAIRTIESIRELQIFTHAFQNLDDLVGGIERGLADVLKQGAKEYGNLVTSQRLERNMTQIRSIDQSEAQS